jgi:predicted ATPase
MLVKILNLRVEGFRSLKSVDWSPGDLNVVIGPNGSGKSNLLRVLELVSASARKELAVSIQSSGGIRPLLWDGEADAIEFGLRTTPLDFKLEPQRYALEYRVKLVPVGKASAYRVQSEILFNDYRVRTGKQKDPFKFLEREKLGAKIFDEENRALTAPEDSVVEDETLLSIAAGPFSRNRVLTHFQEQLANWTVYQYLDVGQNAVIRQPAVTRLEKRIQSDGQNLINVLHTLYTSDRDFKREINAAMKAAFGDDFEELVFPPAADQRIQLRVRWKSLRREQSAADLSDGTLRFLFLLAVLAGPDPPPLVAIDEPETGLHPSMLPIVAEYAVDAARRTQVILTTHSPQFLDAFQETVPTTTVVEWAEGETKLKTISGESLDYWLKESSLGALYRSGELEDMT